jgi:hypothetical protein
MSGDRLDHFFESWFKRHLASDTDAATKMFFRAAFYGGVEVTLFITERLAPELVPQATALWKAEIAAFEKQLDAVRHVADDETKQ